MAHLLFQISMARLQPCRSQTVGGYDMHADMQAFTWNWKISVLDIVCWAG